MSNLKKPYKKRESKAIFLLCFFFLPYSIFSQEKLPVVNTVFSFPDSIFVDISKDDKNDIAAYIGEKLALHGETHHGFLDWAPIHSTEDTSQNNPVLKLQLAGKKNSMELWEISLQFSGSIEGRDYKLYEQMDPIKLYGPFEDQPTHNPEKLQEDIENELARVFNDDENCETIHEHFLNKISLAKLVHPLPNKFIVIPLSWESLKASKNSKLDVSFVKNSLPGNMELALQGPTYRNNWKGYVLCVVNIFHHPQYIMDNWDDIVVPEVSNLSPDSVKVFMAVYSHDEHPLTIGTLAEDPNLQ